MSTASAAQHVETVTDEMLASLGGRLVGQKEIRMELPFGGVLHIDRPLPFVLLYRRPSRGDDPGTESFIRGEASYISASGSPKFRPDLVRLFDVLAGSLARLYGACLVIEIFSCAPDTAAAGEGAVPPSFTLFASHRCPPTAALDALARSLRSVRIHRRPATVSVRLDGGTKARVPRPLVGAVESQKLHVYTIGLGISPVYRHPRTGELYPLVLRSLQRGLSRAFRRSFFEFSHSMTTYRPLHYHVLGRTAVRKQVLEIDRELVGISRSFDLVLHATPVNIEKSWAVFRRSKFESMPELYYRPLAVDPDHLKRQLFRIPLDRVEDSTLAFLFRQKRREIDRQLSMLLDRGKRTFLYGSLQLYGPVDPELLDAARYLLHRLSPRRHDESSRDLISARDLETRAHEELDVYRSVLPGMGAGVEIRDDILGLLVSKGTLYIGKDTRVARSRMEALIEHEVGTHILTWVNGSCQPFLQLSCGFAGYEELQEGLAVLAEYFAGGLSGTRMRLLAGRVVAAESLVNGATFVDVWRQLNREYGFNQRTAFTIAIRIFRAGGLTKDAIYLRGLLALLGYLKKGGELLPLLVGKIGLEHVPLVRELMFRKVVSPPPLHPRYMLRSDFEQKLNALQSGVAPIDLVTGVR
ncbi:DUF1704 domain-containing protein [Prosthecochloris sp. ZM_2]|uniref:flavohemoglobin expression-modulating QEGLA motif protein n=1 Tax=Prosthecochloris sp. ZM_2 TaxID=2045206 RepID=UPI000DF73400|nr:tyrosine/phenylalanine carboxypeptidase domain-containing protein [Prosthecochloris sp. ZM_2]RNA64478.1 DUF1704 domain-containing protein [Prosthecochloris sp. ZM_2]